MTSHTWLLAVVHALRTDGGVALPAAFPSALSEAWEVALRLTGCTDQRVAQAVADHFSLPLARLDRLDAKVATRIPYAFSLSRRVIVIGESERAVQVAMADPTDKDALEQVRFSTGHRVEVHVQSPSRIEAAVLSAYAEADRSDDRRFVDLDAAVLGTALHPVVQLAQQLMREAVRRRVSDLHIQPFMGGYLVRGRIDGVLQRLATLSRDLGSHVIRHFKAIGGMDSSNALIPQDGRWSITAAASRFDIRLSTVPNAQGERLVMRLLNQSKVFSLERLGYAPSRVHALRRIVRLDSGLVLFVGPTGCGKTTSLYALIASLNSMQRSIATIEQPVEYVLPGLSQVEVRPGLETGFATMLRAQLRQDPDVLLIGEIRDEETAEAATRAALTGHLVFSTLHTSRARYAIPRLMDLGVSVSMLGETLMAVVAQRLVRKLCTHCAAPVVEPLSHGEQLFEQITRERPAMRAVGCEACDFTGFHGVTPVVELYQPSPAERAQMIGGTPSPAIWTPDEQSHDSDHPDDRPMVLRVMDLVVSGVTTVDEALSIMGIGFWSALARHYKSVGWFDESVSDAELAARGNAACQVLVSSSNAEFVAELDVALEGAGHRVVPMPAGADPRELLRRNPDALLLLFDLDGNDDDAVAALKSLRQSYAWSGISAFVMVPPEATQLREALHQVMGHRVIDKPVSAQQVAEAIRGLAWAEL